MVGLVALRTQGDLDSIETPLAGCTMPVHATRVGRICSTRTGQMVQLARQAVLRETTAEAGEGEVGWRKVGKRGRAIWVYSSVSELGV